MLLLPDEILNVLHPGFDYDFSAIQNESNELFCAYKNMFEVAISQQGNILRQVLSIYLPIIDVIFVSFLLCLFHKQIPYLS